MNTLDDAYACLEQDIKEQGGFEILYVEGLEKKELILRDDEV